MMRIHSVIKDNSSAFDQIFNSGFCYILYIMIQQPIGQNCVYEFDPKYLLRLLSCTKYDWSLYYLC